MTTPELTPAQASEYNHYLLIDQSGSMGEPSSRIAGKKKWQEVAETAAGFADYIASVDDDGFDLILFGSSFTTFEGLKDSTQVRKIFTENMPKGSTNLAAAFGEATRLWAKAGKKAMFHVYTDGVPDSQPAVVAAITVAVNRMTVDADLAINIMQVGNDDGAAKFLRDLDDNLKTKFDAVNCLSPDEADKLSYGQICWLALND